jgi:TM2 domain-containing membrane protein YozV
MSEKIPGAEKKIICGIFGILLGWMGIHKFILGYTTEGILMLVVSIVLGIFTCGIGASVMGIIGLIEGIIYLTKTDVDFVNTYITNKRGWF